MKSTLTPMAVSAFILIAVIVMSAAAGQIFQKKVPVIICFQSSPDVVLVEEYGGDIKYQYHAIPAIAAVVPQNSIMSIKADSGVRYVELDSEVYIDEEPLLFYPDEKVPWGVCRIEADRVHDLCCGSGVKVALIDTGIDYMHPDLAGSYHGGYDFVNSDADPMDDKGHGTHVAGIIAAADDGIGVIGVSPGVELYALKVLDHQGTGWLSDINAAIDWAIDNDMDVISMSLGGSDNFTSMFELCQAAYDSGIVIVAAAGNSYGGNVSYPAAYDQVIAVSAISIVNSNTCFSSSGNEIELCAPGSSIYSTTLEGGYDHRSGTSMAAPHVSGAVALLLSVNSTLSPVEVRKILDATATDLGDEGKDGLYGYGLVNANTSLEAVLD
ncbi:S8 family serine peptidase [Methanolobus sp. WCC4]|uniref:S8 family serine peptidase n=1 Tax=Methanolobus sp. WCC4 TaxID=3125784 RepID=UPI0030FA0FDD